MRFGAHSQMFVHDIAEAPAETLHAVAALGMDAIEVHVTAPETFPVDAVVDARDATGLEVVLGVALPAERNTISEDAAVRRAGIDHLRRCVGIAAELGIRKMGGGLHSANGRFVGRSRTAQEWEWSVEALRAVAPDAEASGILLTVEPVSRYSGYFLNSAADAVALVGAVGSSYVKVQLDTWHMNIEEYDAPAAVRHVGGLLGHVHAVESNRGIPGRGHIPWAELFRALREVGYDDLLVFEHFPVTLPQMAARSHTWRDLGSSEDVCVEGARALRDLLDEAKDGAS